MSGHSPRFILVAALVVAWCTSCSEVDLNGPTVLARGLPDTVPLSLTLPEFPPPAETAAGSLPAMVMSMGPPPVRSVAEPTVVAVDSQLRRASLVFTGDTLVHSPLVRQAGRNAGGAGFDFTPMFARVAPLIGAADLAVCHLETPVAPADQLLSTYPLYGVPAEIAPALAWAGYDRCSTASNHSVDRGAAGIDATVAALVAAGVDQSGMARTADEALPSVFVVNGIAIAHLSYTFDLNGMLRPDGEPWRTNLIDDGHVVDDAAAARAAGAEVVIISLHWGTEGVSAPNAYQRDVARWITASGMVDLIVGHHAHVPQPIERVNGTWVVYGMGNFLSNMPTGENWPATTQDGVIVNVDIAETPEGTFTVSRPIVTPTWVDRNGGWVIRPVMSDLADPAVPDSIKARLRESLLRSQQLLGEFIPAAD